MVYEEHAEIEKGVLGLWDVYKFEFVFWFIED